MGIKESTVSPSFCYFNTKNGRRSLKITLYYIQHGKCFVIWNDFKSNHKISNQIQIKSHVFLNQIIVLQIKSLCVIQS